MKMLDHVEEGLIRQRVEIDELQCGFMLGCGTTDAIFIVHQLQEKHLMANKLSTWPSFTLRRKHLIMYIKNSSGWNRGLVSAPGPVHVQGCRKPGKSR